MLNSFFAGTQRTSATSAVKPLRLTAVEEDWADHEDLKIWERVIKGTIEHAGRVLLGMTHQDTTARLLKLEPMSEDGAAARLGGPTATVSALYLHLNTPNCTGNCIALALQLELVSFLSRLTQHMAMDTSEGPVQVEGDDLQQLSTMLGYSFASAVAGLCYARPQYSPPVIIIDTVRAFMELARTGMSEIQSASQFLTGIISITASKNYSEGAFVLYCPFSLLEGLSRNSNAEPSHKRTALRLPAFNGPSSTRF